MFRRCTTFIYYFCISNSQETYGFFIPTWRRFDVPGCLGGHVGTGNIVAAGRPRAASCGCVSVCARRRSISQRTIITIVSRMSIATLLQVLGRAEAQIATSLVADLESPTIASSSLRKISADLPIAIAAADFFAAIKPTWSC
jgi:hypothetical protein